MSFSKFCLVLVLVLAVVVASAPLSAQGSAPSRVRIALVDALSAPELRAEVVRYGPESELPLMLLRRGDVRTEDLLAALAAIHGPRPARPRPANVVSRVAITGHGEARSAPLAQRERAARMLSQVRANPWGRIGNLGSGQWAEFDLAR